MPSDYEDETREDIQQMLRIADCFTFGEGDDHEEDTNWMCSFIVDAFYPC